jgi:hypothetical protein
MGEGNEGQEHLVTEVAEVADRESHEVPVTSRGAMIRSWAILLASISACITAFATWAKPQDHSVTQQSYEELSKRLESMQDQQQKSHDDIVAMRAYLSQRNGEVFVLPSQAAQAAAEAVDAGAPILLRPLVRTSPSASAALMPAASVQPPAIHTFVRADPPPSFDNVLRNSAKK